MNALGAYDFAARDAAAHFRLPLLYIGWDQHMMFCAPLCVPLPPDLPFASLQRSVLPGLYGEHPDFERIDWPRVQWFRGEHMFKPDPLLTLGQMGLRHKSVLRFRTPGLEGLRGSYG